MMSFSLFIFGRSYFLRALVNILQILIIAILRIGNYHHYSSEVGAVSTTQAALPLKLMYLKKFWTGIVLGMVIVLNFESFFFALLASVSLGNKNGCKFQHYDYA